MSIIQRRKLRLSELSLVAEHLDRFGHRYGPELKQSGHLKVLGKLLAEHAVDSQLIEEVNAGESENGATILGVGITGFLDLNTAMGLLSSPPDMPVVEYLYGREDAGESVLLRPDGIQHHNHSEGLVLVFLHFSTPPEGNVRSDGKNVVVLMQSGFRCQYGGYHCRKLFHPIPQGDERGVDSLEAIGFRRMSTAHSFMVFDIDSLDSIPYHPFVSLQRTRKASLGFSPSEKDLLLGALWGRNDLEIAKDLNIAPETVRKRWRSIFRRCEEHPNIRLFADAARSTNNTRGTEKRTLVLKYIDSHLEEIRP